MDNRQFYKDAARMQDREGLLAHQEVDAPINEEEKRWRTAEMGGLGESKVLERVRALAKYRWFITTGLLGIILGFQLVIWNQIRNTTTTCSPQVGGDHVEETKYCSSPCTDLKSAASH